MNPTPTSHYTLKLEFKSKHLNYKIKKRKKLLITLDKIQNAFFIKEKIACSSPKFVNSLIKDTIKKIKKERQFLKPQKYTVFFLQILFLSKFQLSLSDSTTLHSNTVNHKSKPPYLPVSLKTLLAKGNHFLLPLTLEIRR